MAKRETDISLIRKYLNGELDARAMHQLEKRALADPFLMDAMEGYENSNFNQQANLDEITSRLQQRVSKKERRMIIPFRYMAAAASVLVVLTIGGLWLYDNRKPENKAKMAILVKPQPKPNAAGPPETPHQKREEIAALKSPPKPVRQQKAIQVTAEKNSVTSVAKAPLPNQLANAEFKNKHADSILKDTTPLNEMVAMDYGKVKKKDVAGSVPVVVRGVLAPKDKLLQSRVNGVEVETRSTSAGDLKYNNLLSKNITGTVVSNEDRLPLPGASVRIAGTKTTAVTDQSGRFTLPADSSKAKLVIASVGYQTVQVNARNRDSLKTIALQPDSHALREVAISGFGAKKNTPAETTAYPQNGLPGFDKYLKDNAISPDGKTGTVTLSFVVNSDGGVSDFNIIKGLSKATNQKAIDLIKNGPAWTANTNGKPEKVTLKIRFVKE